MFFFIFQMFFIFKKNVGTVQSGKQINKKHFQNNSNEIQWIHTHTHARTHAHTHTRLTALWPGLPRWAGTRKVKPIWIFRKQETVSGSGISWAICKSALRSRQITTSAPHHSVFYRPDALPAAQPTASKHWRQRLDHKPTVQAVLRYQWRLTIS